MALGLGLGRLGELYGRTDAALVRIITPIDPNEDRLQAHNRAVDFAEQIIPLLPAYVPN